MKKNELNENELMEQMMNPISKNTRYIMVNRNNHT